MVGGAVRVGDLDRRACRARSASAAASASARGVLPAIAAPAPANSAPLGGDGHQRMQRERLVRGEHVERRSRPSSGRRAARAAIAPPRRAISPSGTHSSTTSASGTVGAAAERAVDLDSPASRSASRERAAETARADDRQRMRAGVSEGESRSSSRIGDTGRR